MKVKNEFDELADDFGIKDLTTKQKLSREAMMLKTLASNKKILVSSIVVTIFGVRGIVGYIMDIINLF